MNMNDNNNMMTLPKKGLKTRPYNIGMEKRDLKKYDYTMYMDMEKEYLKKLSKGQLIRLLLKQKKSKMVSNHETCLTTTHLRMKLHKSLQHQGLTDHFKCKMHEDHQNQLENHHQSLKLKIA